MSEKKTILSIDLDILMSPYCGIYNQFISGVDRVGSWAEAKALLNISDFTINSEYKNTITDIISTYQNQVDKVYVGEDHGTILKALEAENLLNEDLNIINIDYHHDINYTILKSDRNKNVNDFFEEAAVSHWAGYLLYKNNHNFYTWYRGIGSEFNLKFFMSMSIVPLNYKNFKQEIFNNTFPLDMKIDMLYIVPSLPWIPKHCDKELNEVLNLVDPNKVVNIKGYYSDQIK